MVGANYPSHRSELHQWSERTFGVNEYGGTMEYASFKLGGTTLRMTSLHERYAFV